MNIIDKLNQIGKDRVPLLFIIDFDIINPIIIPFDQAANHNILFDIEGIKNYDNNKQIDKKINLKKYPIDYKKYLQAFNKVKKELCKGNSYLVNLTFPTEIQINLTLKEIFFKSDAKYKLLYKDKFVVFSPEIFVKIEDNKISTYPMKGTIDGSIPDAENKILNDEKEFAEHITIVDLLRNDLAIVSNNIYVEKFRYLDTINTADKKLLQVSSKITGNMDDKWNERLGDILYSLLPAGSITGAPKKKTVEIIKDIEGYERGYYTGIFGYFDGVKLNSAVMIRFIEKINDKLFYKSGGGITIYSDPKKEYREMIDKIYVPNNRNN